MMKRKFLVTAKTFTVMYKDELGCPRAWGASYNEEQAEAEAATQLREYVKGRPDKQGIEWSRETKVTLTIKVNIRCEMNDETIRCDGENHHDSDGNWIEACPENGTWMDGESGEEN